MDCGAVPNLGCPAAPDETNKLDAITVKLDPLLAPDQKTEIHPSAESPEDTPDFKDGQEKEVSVFAEICLACHSKKDGSGYKFYGLREEREYAKPWLVYSARSDLVAIVLSASDEEYNESHRGKYALCERHFSETQFINGNGCPSLKWNAIPDVGETMPKAHGRKVDVSANIYAQILKDPERQDATERLTAIMAFCCGQGVKLKNQMVRMADMSDGSSPTKAKKKKVVEEKTPTRSTRRTERASRKSPTPTRQLRPKRKKPEAYYDEDDDDDDVVLDLSEDDGDSEPFAKSRKVVERTDDKGKMEYWTSPFFAVRYSNVPEKVKTKKTDRIGDEVKIKSQFDLRMKAILSEAFATQSYTDVTIICGKVKFEAHKVVLSAFSTFFKEILLEQEKEDDVTIFLDGFSSTDVSNAFGFLYNGVILVDTFKDLSKLRSVLDQLEIRVPLPETPSEPEDNTDFPDFDGVYFPDEKPEVLENTVKQLRKKKKKSVQTDYEASDSDDETKPEAKIECPLSSCNRKFTSHKAMRQHALSHDEPDLKSAKCAFCDELFSTLKDRNLHEESHTDSFRICETCGKNVFHRDFRHRHTREVKVCDLCGKSVHNFSEHMRQHKGNFNCDVCGKILFDAKRLNFHKELQHSGTKRYPCQNCLITFASKEELDEHDRVTVKFHHVDCPVCKRTLGKKEYMNLRLHLSTHAVKEAKELPDRKCNQCPRLFTTDYHLQNHLILHYMPTWKYECSKCYSVWGTAGLSTRHEGKCNGLPKPKPKQKTTAPKKAPKNKVSRKGKQQCPHCGKVVCNYNFLKVHIAAIHDKKFPCFRCSKIFNTKNERRDHALMKHGATNGTGRTAKKYPCVLCDKEVTYPNMKHHLLGHSRMETKNLAFPSCSRCPRHFQSMFQLQNHLLGHYQPQRTIECQHCCLLVRSEAELEMHLPGCEGLVGKKVRVRGPRTAPVLPREPPHHHNPHIGIHNSMHNHTEQQLEEVWKCSECEASFATKRDCELHINLCH